MSGRDITAAAAERHGLRAVNVTAEWLFERLPADGEVVHVWNGYGRVGSVERFSAKEMRRAADGAGVEVLRPLPARWGRVLLRHPLGAGRRVRVLVRRDG